MNLSATVVIATKNRLEELEKAVASAVSQDCNPEVIVIDDGSTDGTTDAIKARFPTAKVVRYDVSAGYITRRNIGARLASGDVVFSIDDDAEFSSPHVVSKTLAEFREDCVAAVAIPYIEPNKDSKLMQVAPDSNEIWITNTYKGTAHAIRRAVFLSAGSYFENFVHQGEEDDLAARLFSENYFVKLGNSDPIIHYESPKRDFKRVDFFAPRNVLLFQWRNTPTIMLFPALTVSFLRCLCWSFEPGRFRVRVSGLLAAIAHMHAVERKPMSFRRFRLWRRLKTHGPLVLRDVKEFLR
jgi:glycosyltransferase involved in cell wall biosynthesis